MELQLDEYESDKDLHRVVPDSGVVEPAVIKGKPSVPVTYVNHMVDFMVILMLQACLDSYQYAAGYIIFA